LELLRKASGASEALDGSEKRLRGKLKPFLALVLPFIAAGFLLDGLGLLLPDWIALPLLLPSLAASVLPIALADSL
jgi:hypothetical protein